MTFVDRWRWPVACVAALAWLGCGGDIGVDGDSCPDEDGDGLCDTDDCDPKNAANTSENCRCSDRDGDAICDAADCAPDDPTNDSCDCSDRDADGHCDADDCAPDDPGVWECGCSDRDNDGACDDQDCMPDEPGVSEPDSDGDGVCDSVDCYPNDPGQWDCCPDRDFDGVCDDQDCMPDEYRVSDCDCADADADDVCDPDDVGSCVNDLTGEYLCGQCTAEDDVCLQPWMLAFCSEQVWDGTNCATACTENPSVYGQTCAGAPASTGQCSVDDHACRCWCDDQFQRCSDGRYARFSDGVTEFELDCAFFCGGTCSWGNRGCSCP